MLNLVNKIITVIFTLFVMINNCNGFIPDKNVLLDKDKFTSEEIETCKKFKEESSQYLINNYLYFVDKSGNYYVIHYSLHGTTEDTYAPFTLYELDGTYSGEFQECKDGFISFEGSHKHLKLGLKGLHFFKPVDRFIQPPELEDANKVENVKTCEEFNDKVVQESTTGFVIYKNKLTNGFTKSCFWKGCARHTYLYSNLPKPRTLNELFLRPEPFGFYWEEKSTLDNQKILYQNCDDGRLNFITSENGKLGELKYWKLSNFTFYNIKSKTRRLEEVELHLSKKLSTCKQFEEYLRNHKNILDGYIYFSSTRDPKNLIYYAMKVNLYGPEDSREKAYLLKYKKINSKYDGFAPVSLIELFVGCESQVFKNDKLIYEVDDSSYGGRYFRELKELLFYDADAPYSEGSLGLEMKVLKKNPS